METQDHLREGYKACGNLQMNQEKCSCPETACPLHGFCCACVAWHRDCGLKPLPHCLRDLDGVSWEPRPARLA